MIERKRKRKKEEIKQETEGRIILKGETRREIEERHKRHVVEWVLTIERNDRGR